MKAAAGGAAAVFAMLGGWIITEGERRGTSDDIQSCAIVFDSTADAIVQDTATTDVNLEDSFSIGMWVNLVDITTLHTILDITSAGGVLNQILISIEGATASDPVNVFMTSNDGTTLKDLDWIPDIVTAASEWMHILITRDGTDGSDEVKCYINGRDQGAADTSTVDTTGTMDNTDAREVHIGQEEGLGNRFGGSIHSVALWSSVLTANEVASVFNVGFAGWMDLNADSSDYESAATLEHWWRLGLDTSDIGKDYTDAGTAIALTGVSVDATNVHPYSPEGCQIDFLGSADYLANTTDAAIGITNAFTMAVWMRTDTTNARDMLLQLVETTGNENRIDFVWGGNVTGDQMVVNLYDSSGTLFKVYNGPTFVENTEPDEWIQFFFTWDGTTLRMGQNGMFYSQRHLTRTTDDAGTLTATNRTVGIGADIETTPTEYFNGQLHSVAIWSTVLTDDQMAEIFNGGCAAFDIANETDGVYYNQGAKDSLEHWWLLGCPVGSGTGTDFTSDKGNGTGINVEANDAGLDASDTHVLGGSQPGVHATKFWGPVGAAWRMAGAHVFTTMGNYDLNLDDAFSYAGWVQPASAATAYCLFSAKSLSALPNQIEFFYAGNIANDPIRLKLWDNAGTNFKIISRYLSTETPFMAGEWYHFAFTYDGSDTGDPVVLYINGVATDTDSGESQTDDTGTMDDTDTREVGFCSTSAGGSAFSERVGMGGTWTSVLTAAEIQQLYAVGPFRDWRSAFGAYDSQADLNHYWDPGRSATDQGSNMYWGLADSNKSAVGPAWTLDGTHGILDATDINWDQTTGYHAFDRQNTEWLETAAVVDVNFGNAFTISAMYEADNASSNQTLFAFCSASDDVNSVYMSCGTPNGEASIKLYDSAGTLFKHYDYAEFDAGSHMMVTITWDGTTLLIYHNGSVVTPSSTATNDSGTMTNTNRRYISGGQPNAEVLFDFDGEIFNTAWWNVVLDADAITAMYDSGAHLDFDLNANSGNYDNSGDLQGWHQGMTAKAIGWPAPDLGNSATLVNLTPDAQDAQAEIWETAAVSST